METEVEDKDVPCMTCGSFYKHTEDCEEMKRKGETAPVVDAWNKLSAIEESFQTLEGFLIEPIENDDHKDPKKRRVIEIQSKTVERDFAYSDSFVGCLIELGNKYKKEVKNGN